MIVARSSLCHFTRQPQSILWHLQYAFDNVSRQGTMQFHRHAGCPGGGGGNPSVLDANYPPN